MILKKKLQELAFNFIDINNDFNIKFLTKFNDSTELLNSKKYRFLNLTDDSVDIIFLDSKSKLLQSKLVFIDNNISIQETNEVDVFPNDGLSDLQFLNTIFDGNAKNLFQDLYSHIIENQESETESIVIRKDENRQNFQTYVTNDRNVLPNGEILEKINQDTFAFGENVFFTFNAPKLSSDEFNRCVDIYNRRIPNGDSPMNTVMLMMELGMIEMNIRKELEDLAIELVKKMYNPPSSIDLRAIIRPQIDPSEECDSAEPDEDNISDERKLELKVEIEKRRILNSIVHGCAVHQWTSAYFLVQDELNELNPQLIEKYNTLSASVNFWNWMIYYEEMMLGGQMPMLQGINKIDIKEKKIEAKAMNFPTLIHELSKGIIDFLISHGIPKNLTDDELKYIYKEADEYAHEQWHYFFGPTLWRALLNVSQVESKDLAPIIMKISTMSYNELSNFCIDIVFNPETCGKEKMNKIIDDIKNASTV